MAVVDLYSKRKKRAQGEVLEVYRYDIFPVPLRVQLVHVFDDVIGDQTEYFDKYKGVQAGYRLMVDILCREYGLFTLTKSSVDSSNHYKQFRTFLLEEPNVDRVLDAVELAVRVINRLTRKSDYRELSTYNDLADRAIEEINTRMREHGVGYVVQDEEILRIDSQVLHSEVVKPALKLLNAPGYDGVQEEYLAAYEHYRHGRAKEALNECLKAFESMMKVICANRGWNVGRGTAGDLIKAIFENKLVPDFWQSHFTSLRSMLESGVPTGRNRMAGHGQGGQPTEVPDDIVAYTLHMTGAAIVLLSERDKALD
ncbi:hypothetical protein PQR21_14885 [Paraburkholderia nemoris]|uniref:STM4504/CBY_0614 family protein n=1 Tax=Paraburkholderia nemoris TaxID=2793076 RepID=UPI0038BC0A7B